FALPQAKIFLIQMMDVSFRPKDNKKVAAFVKKVIQNSKFAASQLFTKTENLLVEIFLSFGYKFPGISIPVMLSKIRKDAKNVVFLKDSNDLKVHIQNRKQNGIKSNINLIGESLLGEEEARFRIQQYKNLLHQADVNYISIKVSTIYSQINILAFEETIDILSIRLSELYDEILTIEKVTGIIKFINLDMEEYRDMSITVGVFIKTLSLDRLKNLKAGIVLQAYIPDSYLWLLKLQTWASQRVENGGAVIKIRVVKGANLEMEKTESALQGWPLVTFDTKVETDANYKKMILALLTPHSCQSIKVGIASHNVFDLAFAIEVVKENLLQHNVEFEMLEGMSNNVVDILKKVGLQVLLYTPVVKPEQYISAIAYLVRRLDEGTANGNFLKEGFDLLPGTPKWEYLKHEFEESLDLTETILHEPRRIQNRLQLSTDIQAFGFKNEPDTDWILPNNRYWLHEIKTKWQNNFSVLPSVMTIKGVSTRARETVSVTCWQGILPWKHELANEDDYHEALLKGNSSSWFNRSPSERIKIIRNTALELKNRRADLIGVSVTEVGKLVTEIDPEVSEAIDFANYYAYCMEQMLEQKDIEIISGKVNLVLSPWNFPVAIPAGGILASLVIGNAVILKPSQNAVACSYILCECLWKAGVPEDALFFLPAKEETLSPFLKAPNVFGSVILTGGTDTAKFLLKKNTKLPLFAETGGKNATIVTSLSDREQAIAHVIHSAFGNAGQKCSSTSLLILEKEVYEDEEFKKLLIDAVQSLKVGSPWDFSSKVGPLAVLPGNKVHMSISNQSNWFINPIQKDWYLHPSIKWGVKKDDFEYCNELFAPILSVMCAENLADAVNLVNNTNYGLTSGIESLDEDEINYWKENIQAGNLYINRPTTGAIVQRQPFGGIKQSCFGFGMKAGGVNYLSQFVDIQKSLSFYAKDVELADKPKHIDKLSKEDQYELKYAIKDYRESYERLFAHPFEEVRLRGQFNIKRYLKPEKIILCIDGETDFKPIIMVTEVCKILNTSLEIYCLGLKDLPENLKNYDLNIIPIQSWDHMQQMLNYNSRFRILSKNVSESFRIAALEKAIHLYEKPVLPFGRYEFLNYITEQSISHNYHRYGNLMGKE
ncbi:MAG: bifunctional proline dehydrogenase/L-glutamate gamma-semialdehyde dehydrogenase, partial [Opitutaceae bacterium]|nr:bifunctional proline dehydrogenase/L-glutamate gamma-semialdehyde dehydrogenase [Cytophagales bacterium]